MLSIIKNIRNAYIALDIHAVDDALSEGLLRDTPLEVGFDITRNRKIATRIAHEIPEIQFMSFITKSGPLLLFFLSRSP